MARVHAIPFSRWPKLHQELFAQATDKMLPFRRARAKGWAEDTKRSVKAAWGLWLDFRHRQGMSVDCDPVDTVTKPELELFLRELMSRVRYSSASTCTRNMAEALRVMQFSESVAARKNLLAASADLAAAAEPLRDVVTSKVHPKQVYDAAIREMDRTWIEALVEDKAAREYRNALILALAVLTSARRRTLRETSIKDVERINHILRLSYPPSKVKTGKELIRTLPRDFAFYVLRGFRVARRMARRAGLKPGSSLFVVRSGKTISRDWMTKVATSTSIKLLNAPLNLQRMRRLAPTTLMRLNPSKAALAMKALQHANTQETRGYTKTLNSPGALQFHQHMEGLFGDLEPHDTAQSVKLRGALG